MAVVPADLIPLLLAPEFLDPGVVVPVLVDGDKRSRVIELLGGVGAVDEVGVLASGDQGSYRLGGGLTGQPGLLALRAGDLGDHGLNLVVAVDLGTGDCEKRGEFLDPAVVFAAPAGREGQDHEQRQDSCHCFSHLLNPPISVLTGPRPPLIPKL